MKQSTIIAIDIVTRMNIGHVEVGKLAQIIEEHLPETAMLNRDYWEHRQAEGRAKPCL